MHYLSCFQIYRKLFIISFVKRKFKSCNVKIWFVFNVFNVGHIVNIIYNNLSQYVNSASFFKYYFFSFFFNDIYTFIQKCQQTWLCWFFLIKSGIYFIGVRNYSNFLWSLTIIIIKKYIFVSHPILVCVDTMLTIASIFLF